VLESSLWLVILLLALSLKRTWGTTPSEEILFRSFKITNRRCSSFYFFINRFLKNLLLQTTNNDIFIRAFQGTHQPMKP